MRFRARRPHARTAGLLAVLLALPAAAVAWSDDVHRLVNGKAVQTVPAPLRGLLEENAAALRAHAVDPDLWRRGHPDEARNHFLNLAAFPDLASGSVPRTEEEHLRLHGPLAEREGRLPWRVREVYGELVAAFRRGAVESVVERAAVLGHYVADAYVPFPGAAEPRGSGSARARRWETELFARFERQIEPRVTPRETAPVADPVGAIFAVLRDGLAAEPECVATDRAAAGQHDFAETVEDDRYDDAYYSRLFERAGERYAARLTAAAELVGGLWLSAWNQAGRPELDWSYRIPHVRGQARVVVALVEGAGARLVEEAIDRGALPHIDALRREGSFGHVRPPFPARPAAIQATLWTGAWPSRHGVVGDGASVPSGSVLEALPGSRSTALGTEPLWVTSAREGVPTVVVDLPQILPFEPLVTEGLRGGTDSARPPLLFAHGADGIEAAVLDAQDLPRHPATSWDDGQAALEIAVPLGDQTLPGLLLDDPDDPTEGLDTLVLSPTRRRVDGVTLKSAPAGHGEWAFATVGLPTDRGPVFVHFRLFLLSPDGRELLLWHSSGARTIASQRLVESVARGEEGLLPGASHRLYAEGRLGATLWNGGDGTAERRYVDTIRLAVRQQSRMAAFALERTRWGLVVLRLPFPAEPLRLWAGRLDPSRPGHDAALAARLRPFLDDVLLLTDSWVGEIARRVPADAALVVIGDRGLEGADRVLRPNVALADAGLLRVSDSGAIDLAHTKVVYAPTNGGFLVLNRDSRPGGIQPRRGESLVQASAIRAMKALADQSAGDPPIAALFTPDERAAPPGVGGPSGGFLYLRPAPGVALSSEARGPLVETIETRGESFDPARSSAAGMIILAGSGVTGGRRLPDVAAVDVAPTLSRLLGLLPPPQAQGRPLSQALSPAP